MPGVCPGGGGEGCLSFDLTSTLAQGLDPPLIIPYHVQTVRMLMVGSNFRIEK